MRPDHKKFFTKLGARVAALRKECGTTQRQLAEILGCSQQQVVSFEKARCKIPVPTLVVMAETFGVSLEELVGIEKGPKKKRSLAKLERQMEQLARLPKAKQRFVSEMLDTVLQQAS